MQYGTVGGAIAPKSRTCTNCNVRGLCRFDQKRLGGFKGNGPRYIGYRKICDSVEESAAKKDITTCFQFAQCLQAPMVFGRNQRDEGKDGEFISVIAQEGEEIELSTRVAVNALDELVKPPSEIARFLKASGYTIGPDHSQIVTWKDVTYKRPVPSYAEWAESVGGYKDRIMREEMLHQEARDDSEDIAWERAQAKLEKSPDHLVATPVKQEKVPAK